MQGNLEEHIASTLRAMDNLSMQGRTIMVRDMEDLQKTDGLIITGGESTTMWRLLRKTGLWNSLKSYDKPVFGTCAGLILLAKSGSDVDSKKTRQEFLGRLDVVVIRNAFGRQRESFSADLDISGIGRFHAVFIRAPAIESVGRGVEVLARYNNKIVAVKQDKILAAAFHPELTDDPRVHELFLGMIQPDL